MGYRQMTLRQNVAALKEILVERTAVQFCGAKASWTCAIGPVLKSAGAPESFCTNGLQPARGSFAFLALKEGARNAGCTTHPQPHVQK